MTWLDAGQAWDFFYGWDTWESCPKSEVNSHATRVSHIFFFAPGATQAMVIKSTQSAARFSLLWRNLAPPLLVAPAAHAWQTGVSKSTTQETPSRHEQHLIAAFSSCSAGKITAHSSHPPAFKMTMERCSETNWHLSCFLIQHAHHLDLNILASKSKNWQKTATLEQPDKECCKQVVLQRSIMAFLLVQLPTQSDPRASNRRASNLMCIMMWCAGGEWMENAQHWTWCSHRWWAAPPPRRVCTYSIVGIPQTRTVMIICFKSINRYIRRIRNIMLLWKLYLCTPMTKHS